MVQNMMARSPMGKPKVLLLGISYPCVEKQMEKHGFDKDLLIFKDASDVNQAVECARRGILTEMDARDLARCVATENVCEVDCYSASREIGGVYRDDRHVYGDFNNRNFCKSLKKAFGDNIQFSQVILDYYWMPSGWLVSRWAKTLFQQTLPDLVKLNMLTYPGSRSRNTSLFEEGVVYLPFCAHVCKELVGGINVLSKYYSISFVNKTELGGHSLWNGTMSIDANTMQHVLGKRLDQEEVYCTFRKKDIFEHMEDSHVSKSAVMRVLEAIEDYENIRMIRLRPLKQHEGPSVMKVRSFEIEKGGFIGLNYELAKEKPREQKEAERINKRKVDEEKRSKKEEQRAKTNELKAQQDVKLERVVSHVEEIPVDESKYKMFFSGPAANSKAYIEPGVGVTVQGFPGPFNPPSRFNSPSSAHPPSSPSSRKNSASTGTSGETVPELPPPKHFLARNPCLARVKVNRPEEFRYEDYFNDIVDVNITKIGQKAKRIMRKKAKGMNMRWLIGEQLERAKRAGYVGSAVEYVYIPEDTHEVYVACKLMGMRMKSRGLKEVKSQVYDREETKCFRVPEHSMSNPKELSSKEKALHECWKISIERSLHWYKHNLNPLFDPDHLMVTTKKP